MQEMARRATSDSFELEMVRRAGVMHAQQFKSRAVEFRREVLLYRGLIANLKFDIEKAKPKTVYS